MRCLPSDISSSQNFSKIGQISARLDDRKQKQVLGWGLVLKYIELVMIIILILIKQVTGDGPTIRYVCSQKIFFLLDKMCCIKVAPGTYFSPSKVKQPANYLRPWSSFKVHLFLFVHYAITALNTFERFALVLEKVRTCSALIFLIKYIDRCRTMTINNEFGSSSHRWHLIHHWPNLQGTSKSMGAALLLIWRSTGKKSIMQKTMLWAA